MSTSVDWQVGLAVGGQPYSLIGYPCNRNVVFTIPDFEKEITEGERHTFNTQDKIQFRLVANRGFTSANYNATQWCLISLMNTPEMILVILLDRSLHKIAQSDFILVKCSNNWDTFIKVCISWTHSGMDRSDNNVDKQNNHWCSSC